MLSTKSRWVGTLLSMPLLLGRLTAKDLRLPWAAWIHYTPRYLVLGFSGRQGEARIFQPRCYSRNSDSRLLKSIISTTGLLARGIADHHANKSPSLLAPLLNCPGDEGAGGFLVQIPEHDMSTRTGNDTTCSSLKLLRPGLPGQMQSQWVHKPRRRQTLRKPTCRLSR